MAQIHVWNGSAWTQLKAAKVWNGTSWVQFHPGVVLDEYPPGGGVLLYSGDLQFFPTPASATVSIVLNSNGSASYADNISTYNFTWLLSGSNSDYYAYMDTPTGDSFTAGTVATALQLNTTRTWSLTASQSAVGIDNKSLTSTLRIQNSSGTDIVSVAVSLSALAEVQP